MSVYYCDLAGVDNKKDLLAAMVRGLELPESVTNLDALNDVVGEYRRRDTVIVYNTKEARETMPAYFDSFEEMGRDNGFRFYP